MSTPTVLCDASALDDARRHAGIGRYTGSLLAALAERDDVRVVSAAPLGPPRSESRPYRWLRAQLPLAQALRRTRASVVHAMTGDPALGVSPGRQVCTVHDAYLWTAPLPAGPRAVALRAFRTVVERRLRRAAAIVTTSEPTADDVVAALGLDRRRVHVIPLGVGPAFTDRAADTDDAELGRTGLPRGDYLLFTGNLRHHDPRKCLDVLLEAVHRLGDTAPPLVLAGSTGEESQRLQHEAARLHVDLRLTGAGDDAAVAALYRNAAAFVMPSRYEGFGLSVLEAMACGAPVVATTGGNLPHLTGGAASLVPAGDVAALADALATMLHDSGLRERLRREGVARAAGFTWERCAAATAAVYQQVASAL